MAFSTEHVGDELLDSITRPYRNLPDLLDALMYALAERTGLTAGSLTLDDFGTLIVGRIGEEIACEWISAEAGAILRESGPWREPRVGALVLPICYANSRLGELRLELSPPSGPDDPEMEQLRQFARQCALLVKRYHVRRWSEQRLGRPLMIVGMSKALRELEDFVEISARRILPVLLRGEFGTEKVQLAAAIHCCSEAVEGPFVQVDCAEPYSSPGEWLEEAEGGTLYLSDIEELEPRIQKQLPKYLPSRLHQWLPPTRARKVRVIASTAADLHERARQGLFSRPLLAEIDFLTVTIPPLRERPGDIEPLVWHALERHGYRAEEKSSEILLSLCRAHDWPENLYELERLIARLAVMSERRPIQLRDISRHAPSMVRDLRLAELAGEADDSADDEKAAAERWVRCATEGGGPQLNGMHESLRRALIHLGEHYDEQVSLAALAHRAGVSGSHLGHLFRSGIGMSFKALLGHIRINKAREMLTADRGHSITDIALTVGFSDLSHFERTFRRIVGKSPREFRRSAGPG